MFWSRVIATRAGRPDIAPAGGREWEGAKQKAVWRTARSESPSTGQWNADLDEVQHLKSPECDFKCAVGRAQANSLKKLRAQPKRSRAQRSWSQ